MWEPCPTPGRSWAPSGPKEALPCLGGRGHTEAAWGCSWRKSCNRAATGSCGFQEELGGSNLVSSFWGERDQSTGPDAPALPRRGFAEEMGRKRDVGVLSLGTPALNSMLTDGELGVAPASLPTQGLWACGHSTGGLSPRPRGGFCCPGPLQAAGAAVLEPRWQGPAERQEPAERLMGAGLPFSSA